MVNDISVILGDPHIGRSTGLGRVGIGSGLNSRIIDQINILDFTLDNAIKVGATYIIITGDIFEDSRPHPTFITLFMNWLHKCVDSNIVVHILMGNHDLLRSGQFNISALDIISSAGLENVYVHKTITTIHTNGASYTIVPFRDRRSFNTDSNADALNILGKKIDYEVIEVENNQYKVVIGHLAIENSIMVGDEIDDMVNELFCPVSMFNGYDYGFFGHIHKPQILSVSPYIAHIGSMDLSDFGETDHTKILAVFDPSKSQPLKYIDIPTRPLKQISVSVPENIINSTEYVVKELENNEVLKNAIVKLNIHLNNSNTVSIDRTEVEGVINKLGAFHIARISEERKSTTIKTNQTQDIDNTVNELTAIKMYASSNIEKEYQNDFISLASSIVNECKSEKVIS